MTKLTVPITAVSLNQAIDDIRRSAQAGADLVEIRLDYLASVDYQSLVENSPVPILWTLRHSSEGGKFTGSVESQIDQLSAAISAGGNYVDIEFQRWTTSGKAQERLLNKISQLRTGGKNVKLILSCHDFQATSPDILSLAQKVAADPFCDIIKIAGYAKSVDDNFLIFDFLKNSTKPAVGIAMGPLGSASRLLAGKFQAELIFAALSENKSSAPGQLTIGQMKEEYNWDHLNPKTQLAAVIGHPVNHSLSPIMHNQAYKQMGLDAIYLKFDVADSYEDFARFIDGLRARPWLDCVGLSVTIPHKTNAIRYLKNQNASIDPLAEKIGAVNTLVFNRDGSLAGYNTDYLGVLETLRVIAGVDKSALKNKHVNVLGGGGVCRAIVAAMTSAGADVTIFNRTAAKAQSLAEEFQCRWVPWEKRNSAPAEIFINGTSLGMHPHIEECPLDSSALRPGMIVFDTVYNPLETRLLQYARQAQALPVNGADMLVYQAAQQINLWFNREQKEEFFIPIDIMKNAVLSKLRDQE
ncbi:MAG: shikimate dehydrogenase [Phycisphaerae bacterium]